MKSKKSIFWIIFAFVIIGVILAIVFVSLFGNKDTQGMAKSVNSYTTSDGYLSKNGTRYEKVDSYLTKLLGSLSEDKDKIEVKNLQDGLDAYLVVSDFFENEIRFMKYTTTYKNKHKSVEKKLSSAQKSVDKLISQIEKNSEIVDGNEFWQKRAWENCKENMINLLTNTIDAFNVVSEIYADSVSSYLLNNEFSNVMFLGLKNLSNDLKANLSSVAGSGEKLLSYSSLFFTKSASQKILDYAFSESETQKNILKDILEKGSESEYYKNFVEQGIVG